MKQTIITIDYENKKTVPYEVYRFKGKIQDVILKKSNYIMNIKPKRTDINLEKIAAILEEPEAIFKLSRLGKEYLYEKFIDGKEYRVVVIRSAFGKSEVLTAGALESGYSSRKSNMFCVYRKYRDVLNGWMDWLPSKSTAYEAQLAAASGR